MTWYDVYWLVWAILGFGIVEGIALAHHNYAGTLTAHFRRWFGFEAKTPEGQKPVQLTPWRRFRRAVGLGFITWLAFHLVGLAGRF